MRISERDILVSLAALYGTALMHIDRKLAKGKLEQAREIIAEARGASIIYEMMLATFALQAALNAQAPSAWPEEIKVDE